MKLDVAAPIVQVAETDVAVAAGEPVMLAATTSAGTITWYESNLPIATGNGSEITDSRSGTHLISAIATDDAERIGMAGVVVNVVPPTKFYVVDDATPDQTYEYDASFNPVESYALNSGNSAPRGAASTTAGDKLWVVDANRNVYVYSTSGGLPTSWTVGTLNSKSVVEGIATDGTDVWIVDAKTDKVYKYTGAASRTSGSSGRCQQLQPQQRQHQPQRHCDRRHVPLGGQRQHHRQGVQVHHRGALVSSWTITTPGAASPTGITIDPSNVSDIWIVDNGTDRVYQYNNAATLPNGSYKAADASFPLGLGNTNPQGIADPPVAGRMLTTEMPGVFPTATEHGTDGALVSLYYVPLTQTSSALRVRDNSLRIDTARLCDARVVDSWVAGGESASLEPTVRLADAFRWARDNHRKTEVDDLFAEWESDPLELLSVPDLGQ